MAKVEAKLENPRQNWIKGSEVEIYGSKAKKWFKGRIAGVDEDHDGEWLKVTYKTDKSEIMMRKVQRYSDQVRPIGGDEKYKKIKEDDDDEKDKDADNNDKQKDKPKKKKKKLTKAKEEVIYPADKYLEEAEKEVLESHEKGTAEDTIKLLTQLKCKNWTVDLFNKQKDVAYVCDDGYMLHADIIRVNNDKTKIFVHLGNDYRHYDFNLKQKSIWLSIPNQRIYRIDALEKFKNPDATGAKKDDEEIPNDALEFFRQSSGMSAGELERHKSIGNTIKEMIGDGAKDKK